MFLTLVTPLSITYADNPEIEMLSGGDGSRSAPAPTFEEEILGGGDGSQSVPAPAPAPTPASGTPQPTSPEGEGTGQVGAPQPSQEEAAGQVGPTGLQDLHGDGVRINNAFKPINAPDAINQNYTTDTVNAFLQFIAGSIIELTAGVAIFVLVIAGYMFVTAGGDQGRIDKAKEIIKYTIFGMLLIILSFVIVKTIISLIIEVDTF